jgi:hypothetical protein
MATFGLTQHAGSGRACARRERLLDSVVSGGLAQARSLYVVDAVAGVGMGARAEQVMQSIAGPYSGDDRLPLMVPHGVAGPPGIRRTA